MPSAENHCRAANARCNGRLRVGRGVKPNAELLAGAAGASLANHGQRRTDGARHLLDARLVAHRFGQAGFQSRHIGDPGKRRHLLGGSVEMHVAAAITADMHVQYGGGVFWLGPATQRFQ